jgi:predicted RNA-binding protein with PIN domain
MPARFLIIDGYNLLHAAGLALANYAPGQLAAKRRELLIRIARRLSVEERQRCTVVFDAIDAPPNLASRFKHGEITVQFAKPGQEADEVIEHLISQHSAPRRLTVVSSDHRLQTAVIRRRGLGIDSEVFLKQLESADRQVGPTQHPASTKNVGDTDLNFWLEEFQRIEPEAIESELRAESGTSKSDWDRQVELLQQQLQNPENLDEWLPQSDKHKPPPPPSRKKT